jgi:hypothetical protein
MYVSSKIPEDFRRRTSYLTASSNGFTKPDILFTEVFITAHLVKSIY